MRVSKHNSARHATDKSIGKEHLSCKVKKLPHGGRQWMVVTTQPAMDNAVKSLRNLGGRDPEAIAVYDKAFEEWCVSNMGHCTGNIFTCTLLGCQRCRDRVKVVYAKCPHIIRQHGGYGRCGDRFRCCICELLLSAHEPHQDQKHECLKCCDAAVCQDDERVSCIFCSAKRAKAAETYLDSDVEE